MEVLTNSIEKATQEFIKDGLDEMVKEKVVSMFQKALDEATNSWSPLFKNFKEEIGKKLNINLDKLNLVDYNALILSEIESQLKSELSNNIKQSISRRLNDTMGYVEEKKMTLTDLLEKIKHQIADDSYDQSGECTIYVEFDEKYNWVRVFIDPEQDVTPKQCALEFLIATDDKWIFSMHTKTCWTNKKEPIHPVLSNQLQGASLLIYRYMNSRVLFDIDLVGGQQDGYWEKEHECYC